jgi:GNAT superfamily N-acetyltransferase
MRYSRLKAAHLEATSSQAKNNEYAYHSVTDLSDPKQKEMFESAYKLYCKSFPKEELDSRSSLEEAIGENYEDRKVAWMAATDSKGKVVGAVVVSLYDTDRNQFDKSSVPYDLTATIGYIFTDKNHRRKGIGTGLENKAMQFAGQYNFKGDTPLQERNVLALCDVEDPEILVSKNLGLKALGRLARIAQMTFAERLKFWCGARQYQTLDYPYILCPRPEPGEEPDPNDTLKLRAKGVHVKDGDITRMNLDKLPSAFMNNVVLRWILWAPNREEFEKACPALAKNPLVKSMLDWAGINRWTRATPASLEKKGIERAVILEKDIGLTEQVKKEREMAELRTMEPRQRRPKGPRGAGWNI